MPASTPYPPVPASLTSPSDSNGSANSVAEGAANGTAVGLTALATNTSGQPVSYTLTDNAGGRFAINSTTGVVTVANGSQINYESNPSHTYSITVQANDGILTTSRSFTIGVSDVAPSTPTDANGAANTVAEGAANGTAVGVTAAATDVNGGAITYSLGNDADGAFTIDANGVVTVKDSTKIDFESAGGSLHHHRARQRPRHVHHTQTFTIDVTDVSPELPDAHRGYTVDEGASTSPSSTRRRRPTPGGGTMTVFAERRQLGHLYDQSVHRRRHRQCGAGFRDHRLCYSFDVIASDGVAQQFADLHHRHHRRGAIYADRHQRLPPTAWPKAPPTAPRSA